MRKLIIKQMLKSKKFWAALTGVLAQLIGPALGVPEEAVTQMLYPIIAYILGQGLADFGKEK